MRVSVRKPAKMKLRNKFSELQMDSDLETSNQPEAKNKLSSNAQMLSVDKAAELWKSKGLCLRLLFRLSTATNERAVHHLRNLRDSLDPLTSDSSGSKSINFENRLKKRGSESRSKARKNFLWLVTQGNLAQNWPVFCALASNHIALSTKPHLKEKAGSPTSNLADDPGSNVITSPAHEFFGDWDSSAFFGNERTITFLFALSSDRSLRRLKPMRFGCYGMCWLRWSRRERWWWRPTDKSRRVGAYPYVGAFRIHKREGWAWLLCAGLLPNCLQDRRNSPLAVSPTFWEAVESSIPCDGQQGYPNLPKAIRSKSQ